MIDSLLFCALKESLLFLNFTCNLRGEEDAILRLDFGLGLTEKFDLLISFCNSLKDLPCKSTFARLLN